MSKSNLKILIIDDDPVLIEMHSALLELNDYSVITADDGEKGLAILNSYPDEIGAVISDINMPNMDGYTFCKQAKQGDKTKDIPVIFVSALTNLDEKMKGYEVGADDYITKPVNESELCKKIRTLFEMREQQAKLSEQITETNNIAMQAMTFSSELVQVIEFYKQIFNANNYTEAEKCFFDILSSFSLVSILQIITPGKTITSSASGIVSPLETSVIELARDKGRFIDFGARTIVNYSTFSVLIKNMPLTDSDKYGRIKDILGMLGNGFDARIQQLNIASVSDKNNSVFISIRNFINTIESSLSDLQKDNISAIEDMNEQIHEVIMVLGLTEDQETNIQKITSTCLERSNTAFYKGLSIDEDLNNIYQQFHLTLGTKAGS